MQKEGFWINARIGKYRLIDEHAQWMLRPENARDIDLPQATRAARASSGASRTTTGSTAWWAVRRRPRWRGTQRVGAGVGGAKKKERVKLSVLQRGRMDHR